MNFIQVKSLKDRGDEALHIHDYKEAIAFYNEALEIDDRNVDVLIGRTTAFLEQGEYIKALKDTELMVSIDPENPEVCVQLCSLILERFLCYFEQNNLNHG